MAFYVFDLDGTLADCTHRLHHLERRDWRAFFADCPADAPISATLAILKALYFDDHRVEIWSGRSDEVRDQTRLWLRANGVPDSVPLIMRTAGDMRPDEEIKREFLRMTDRPDVIFDDRSRVVSMWRDEGLTCFQVAPGDF